MAGVDIGRNADGEDAPQIGDDVTKILVVGNKGCGKTTFIRKFGGHNISRTYVDRGAIVYLYDCIIRGRFKQFEFVEIPGLYNIQQVSEHHGNAVGCIFMYAIDDPSSYRNLLQWIINVCMVVTFQVKIVVGFKNDLRKDPKAIYNLELENLTFITEEQGFDLVVIQNLHAFFECCKFNKTGIVKAFDFVLQNTYE